MKQGSQTCNDLPSLTPWYWDYRHELPYLTQLLASAQIIATVVFVLFGFVSLRQGLTI